MKFYPIADLRTDTETVCDSVRDNEEVIITSQGKPAVLMLRISEDDFEETLRAFRQAKTMMTVNRMRSIAAENGYMSEEEIEKEIQSYRAERRRT